MIINISEAKANLSKLIHLAYQGEKIVIAKNNLPLVELVIHQPEGSRQLGLIEGEIEVPDDFCAADAVIEEMFYGPPS